MDRSAIGWCFGTIKHPIVTHDRRDSQPVILENLGTARRLRIAMHLKSSSFFNGMLVTLERKR